MIYYLVTPTYEHTIKNYLVHWAKELEPRVRILFYDDALRAGELPIGTYIFSDLERLLPSETEIAAVVWQQLHAAGARLLNHPTRTLRRYDLLTMLHGRGRNQFRVVRASDRTADLHFPVFLREEGEHSGSLTRLLENQHQLDEALVGATFRSHRLETLLVVEYCNTADVGGIYRKYSAFTVGGRVVPAHIDCSRAWMVKDTDIVDTGVMEQERTYLETNPHREWLEETFALAGVDYGRIDYGLLNGAPQVWEINTNPVVILTPDHYSEIHMPVKWRFAGQIGPAFEAIDYAGEDRMVPISIPAPMIARLDMERARQRRHKRRRSFMHHAVRWAPVRAVRYVIRPMMTPISPLLARITRRRAVGKTS